MNGDDDNFSGEVLSDAPASPSSSTIWPDNRVENRDSNIEKASTEEKAEMDGVEGEDEEEDNKYDKSEEIKGREHERGSPFPPPLPEKESDKKQVSHDKNDEMEIVSEERKGKEEKEKSEEELDLEAMDVDDWDPAEVSRPLPTPVLRSPEPSSPSSDSESSLHVPLDEDAIELREELRARFSREIRARQYAIKHVRHQKEIVLAKWNELQKVWSEADYTEYIRGLQLQKPPNVNWVYYIRPDGTFVRLVCPVCNREDFIGFINHCRMSHHLKFLNMSDASVICGVPVNKDAIPEDDPVWNLRLLPLFANAFGNPSTVGGGPVAVVAPGASLKSTTPGRMDLSPLNELALQSSPNLENSSRFHVKQRVLIGSTSMKLPMKPGQEETHKWMVYVRAPNENVRFILSSNISQNGNSTPLGTKMGLGLSAGDLALAKFISKVRFFIHPSFKPEDIVEVLEPPFQIIRQGWGEFPVRIQLHFHAHLHTKPVNIVHALTLTSVALTNVQVAGPEEEVEIELNRLGDGTEEKKRKREATDKDDNREAKVRKIDKSEQTSQNGNINAPMEEDAMETVEASEGLSKEDRERKILEAWNALLEAAAPQFPLLASGRDPEKCLLSLTHYPMARDAAEWFSWFRPRQLAAEKQRALILRVHVELGEDSVSLPPLTTRLVEKWCRQNGFVPTPPENSEISLSSELKRLTPKLTKEDFSRKYEKNPKRLVFTSDLDLEKKPLTSISLPDLSAFTSNTNQNSVNMSNIAHSRSAFFKSNMASEPDLEICPYCGRVPFPTTKFKKHVSACPKRKIGSSWKPIQEVVSRAMTQIGTPIVKAPKEDVEFLQETPITPEQAKFISETAAVVGAAITPEDSEVQRLLWHATYGFANSLISAVVSDYETAVKELESGEAKDSSNGSRKRHNEGNDYRFSAKENELIRKAAAKTVFLVPRHVHSTITARPEEFDWLSDAGISKSELGDLSKWIPKMFG